MLLVIAAFLNVQASALNNEHSGVAVPSTLYSYASGSNLSVPFPSSFEVTPSVFVNWPDEGSDYTVQVSSNGFSTQLHMRSTRISTDGNFISKSSSAVIDGRVAIAYATGSTLKFAVSSGESDPTEFSQETVWATSSPIEDVRLSTTNGRPRIAFLERSTNNVETVGLATCDSSNGTGPWRIIRLSASEFAAFFEPGIRINGEPAWAYATANELRFVRVTEGKTNDIAIATSDEEVTEISTWIVAGKPAILYTKFRHNGVFIIIANDSLGSSWSKPALVIGLPTKTYPLNLTSVLGELVVTSMYFGLPIGPFPNSGPYFKYSIGKAPFLDGHWTQLSQDLPHGQWHEANGKPILISTSDSDIVVYFFPSVQWRATAQPQQNLTIASPTNCLLDFIGVPGKAYKVQWTPSLPSRAWNPLITFTCPPNGRYRWLHDDRPPRAFYRIFEE